MSPVPARFQVTGMRFSPDLHGASQPGTRDLCFGARQRFGVKVVVRCTLVGSDSRGWPGERDYVGKKLCPVNRDPGQPGLSGCHVIAKLIFDVFLNRHTDWHRTSPLSHMNRPSHLPG